MASYLLFASSFLFSSYKYQVTTKCLQYVTQLSDEAHGPTPREQGHLDAAVSWHYMELALPYFLSSIKNYSNTSAQERGCSLPVLNPFDPSIAQYTKVSGST